MNPSVRRLTTILAALLLLFAASAAAYGYFVDTEQGTGNVTAANSFGGSGGANPGQGATPGPPGGTPGNGATPVRAALPATVPHRNPSHRIADTASPSDPRQGGPPTVSADLRMGLTGSEPRAPPERG